MATTEQIARAKARVALARISGKKLPEEVLQRAALTYSDAEAADSSIREVPEGTPAADAEVSRSATSKDASASDDTAVIKSVSELAARQGALTEQSRAALASARAALATTESVAAQVRTEQSRAQESMEKIFTRRTENARTEQAYLRALLLEREDRRDGRLHYFVEPKLPVVDLQHHAIESINGHYTTHRSPISGPEALERKWYAEARNSGPFYYSHSTYSRAVDDAVEASDYSVRATHRALVDAPSDRPKLPIDDDVRRDLARRLARDIVSMHPGYARMIVDAVEDELTAAEVREAAEDARLG